MKKSSLAILLLFVFLTMCIFSSCTAKTETKTTTPDTSSSGDKTTEEPGGLEHVEINWYMAMWVDYPETDRVMTEVSKIIEEKLNTKVNIHVNTYSEHKTKLSTMISAGQPLDIVFSSPDTVPFLDNAVRGAFYPLEDLLPKYAPHIWSTIPKEAWNAVTVDGHIYAIVPMKDLADTNPMFYDPVFCEKYNLKVPEANTWTSLYEWVDFIYAAKEARDKEYPELANMPIFTGGNFQFTFFYPYEEIIGPAAITIPGMEHFFEDKGSGDIVFNVFDTPEYLQYCKQMRKFVEDGIMPQDAINFNKDGKIDLKAPFALAQGEVVPRLLSGWTDCAISESKYKVMNTTYVRAMLNCISSNTKYPERCLMVLDLVNEDQLIGTMLRFGVENVDWKRLNDKQITFKGTTNEDPKNYTYYHWYGAQWGSIVNMLVPENVDPIFQQKIKDLVNQANKRTALGFAFDAKPVQNEIAACRNVISEYHDLLKYGMLDDVEGNVAEFVAKLKENGVQKIIDEAQRQLDEWRKAAGR